MHNSNEVGMGMGMAAVCNWDFMVGVGPDLGGYCGVGGCGDL